MLKQRALTPSIYEHLSLSLTSHLSRLSADSSLLSLLSSSPHLSQHVRTLSIISPASLPLSSQLSFSDLPFACLPNLQDVLLGRHGMRGNDGVWKLLKRGGKVKRLGRIVLREGDSEELREMDGWDGLEELDLEVLRQPESFAYLPGTTPSTTVLSLPSSLRTLVYCGPLHPLLTSPHPPRLLERVHLTSPPSSSPPVSLLLSFLAQSASTLRDLSIAPLTHPDLLSSLLSFLTPQGPDAALPHLRILRFHDMRFTEPCAHGSCVDRAEGGQAKADEGGAEGEGDEMMGEESDEGRNTVEGWGDVLREVGRFGRERGWVVRDAEGTAWRDCGRSTGSEK